MVSQWNIFVMIFFVDFMFLLEALEIIKSGNRIQWLV